MTMTTQEAEALIAEVAKQRLRWGKMYSRKDLPDKALDALAVLALESNRVDTEQKAEITKLKRQLGAANARVARLAKKYGVSNEEVAITPEDEADSEE